MDECTAGLLTVRGQVVHVQVFTEQPYYPDLLLPVHRLNESCSLKSKHGPERELWSLGCLLFWVFCHLAVTLLPLTAT